MDEQWHYESKGQGKGPVSSEVIRELITNKVIDRQTLLWTKRYTEWLPAIQTPFADYFSDSPPEMPKARVGQAPDPVQSTRAVWNDQVMPVIDVVAGAKGMKETFVWLVAFAPLYCWYVIFVASLLTGLPMGAFFFIYLFPNIVFSYLDQRSLTIAGVDTRGIFGPWLVPVYLFQRCQKVGPNIIPFVVWCVCLLMSFLE
ncbi:DUF4339 domain-containing protein [Kamptonema cortianum]|nr:DUF4339 domain-containing protein [Kamptonema cortianum]